MKKIFWLVCLLPIFSLGQGSYTVCNRPGVTANFATLQGAIDSVAAGSTLYLFPSPVDYGNVAMSKKLTIIGTGYMLDLNNAPYASPNTEGVSVSSIRLKPGSDYSYIQGLQLIGNAADNFTGRWRFRMDSVNNVTINRCLAEIWTSYPDGNCVIQTVNTTNCVFSQCYLLQMNIQAPTHSGGTMYAEAGGGSQNLQFTNNIFDTRGAGPFTFNYNINPNFYGTLIFTNNTFNGAINNSTFCNYTFYNNFFISTNPSAQIFNSTLGLSGAGGYNVTNLTGVFPAHSYNYEGANPDSIFARATFGFHSFDQGLQVVSGSFAKTYASDGGEVGAFGGSNSYVLSGIPTLPMIYSLALSRDTTRRGNVLVHIQAKANY